MANYETRMILISETNINTANNTSYVTVAFEFRRTDYPYYGYNLTGNASWKINVDSQTSGDINFTFNWNIPQNEWKEVGRRGFTVTHNADGSKTIAMSGSINFGPGVSPGTLTAAGSANLSTIPRATTPTLSNSKPAIGSAITINLPRASTAFTHQLTYTFGSTSGTIATAAAASASWTLPNTLALQIPKATSGSGRITCKTYKGSELVGTKTVNFTASVPDTMKPSISSVTISEAVAGLNAQFAAFVQNKSKLKIVTAASGIQGSTITSYKTVVNGNTYSGNSVTTGFITASGTIAVTVTVTDSRGRTASTTKNVNVIAYANPKITTLTAARCTAAGVLNDEGTELSIGLNFSVSAVDNKNTKSYAVELLKNGATAWTPVVSGSVYSYNSTYITSLALSIDSSYTLRLSVTDYFTTTTATVNISSGFTLMDFRSTGKGVAVGKVSEKNAFEVAMDADFQGNLLLKGKTLFDLIYPVGAIYMSTTSTNPGSLFGGTWEAWGAGRVPVGMGSNGTTNYTTVNGTGGAESRSHTHAASNSGETKLALTQIPSHSHTLTKNINLCGDEAKGYGLTGATGFGNRVVIQTSSGTLIKTNGAGGSLGHKHTIPAASSVTVDVRQPYVTCYMWRRTK
ncbi:hypothetical protein GCM10008922_21430 [Faecalicatena contorta]|uniref:DUF859 family phage minor structural protein n=1 Tax=Faecalicatena contorta TaxID=39482 RepID=UPI0031DE55B1